MVAIHSASLVVVSQCSTTEQIGSWRDGVGSQSIIRDGSKTGVLGCGKRRTYFVGVLITRAAGKTMACSLMFDSLVCAWPCCVRLFHM